MTIQEILQSSPKVIKQHIKTLANDYTKRTNHSPCLSCSGDVRMMLQYLNRIYMKSQFQLKLPMVIYKVKLGSGLTISNDIMTDELAIEFLKVKPSRIELFSVYPDNWKQLIGLETEEKDESEEEIKEEAKIESDDSELVKEIVKESSKKPCAGCKDKKISSKKSTPQKRTRRSSKSTKK
ncbi:hypothetical protein [Psychroserpens mesophilus]|uniref:hypothetical protein n=1 Tax=Psychroserpens mesophilus TaxID=325473 RepID=UPI003D65E894